MPQPQRLWHGCVCALVCITDQVARWFITHALPHVTFHDLQTLEVELPDTAASLRLSSLELSDCLTELGALGNDLSGGVRASARMLSAAESGVREGAAALGAGVVPALARRETQMRGRLMGIAAHSALAVAAAAAAAAAAVIKKVLLMLLLHVCCHCCRHGCCHELH
jgi:hypothetical protein